MGRQANSNTFTEGLITDLNPINTPNNVLTDCVNGTIITYNGNEFSLQNDMGNYALQNCKLKENYIPVGLKEYGDILYIVSYNPLDKHVEIGSYPSPKTISSPTQKEGLTEAVNFITPTLPEGVTDYREIVEEKEKMVIFYGNNKPEDYKLYPGDKYQLVLTAGQEENYPYEKLEYYAIDDDRKLYNISDFIVTRSIYDSRDEYYKYVKWDVPGWISIKPRFAYIDDFKINVRKIIVPTYSTEVTLSLNLQLFLTDPILAKEEQCNDLYASLKIYKETAEGSEEVFIGDTPFQLSNRLIRGDGTHIYYVDITPDILSGINCDSNDILYIECTPKLKVSEDVWVSYKEYAKTLVFNIGQKGNPEDFNIGVEKWKYTVHKDENLLWLQFDTVGLESSSVLSADVFLAYSIKRLDGSFVKDKDGNDYNTRLYPGWNLIGETISSFDLEPFTDTDNYYDEHKDRFYAEDFYVFEFTFYSNSSLQLEYKLNNIKQKFMVASELMNDVSNDGYDNLEEVSFDTWINKYNNHILNQSIYLNSISVSEASQNDPTIEYSGEYNIWNSNYSDTYTTFFDKETVETTFAQGMRVQCSKAYNLACTYGSPISVLTGPMWKQFLENNVTVKFVEADKENTCRFGSYTGKISNTFNLLDSGTLSMIDLYKIEPVSGIIEMFKYDKSAPLVLGDKWIRGDTFPADINLDQRHNCDVTITSSLDSKGVLVTYRSVLDDPREIGPIRELIEEVRLNYDLILFGITAYRSDGNQASSELRPNHNKKSRKYIHLEVHGPGTWIKDEDRIIQTVYFMAIPVKLPNKDGYYFGMFSLPAEVRKDNKTGALRVINDFIKDITKLSTSASTSGYFCEASNTEDRKTALNLGNNLFGTVAFENWQYAVKEGIVQCTNMFNQTSRLELIDSSFEYLNSSNFKASGSVIGMVPISFYPDDSYTSEIKGLIDWSLFMQQLDSAQRQINIKSALARTEAAARATDNILNTYKAGDTVYKYSGSGEPPAAKRFVIEVLQNRLFDEYDNVYYKCQAADHMVDHNIDVAYINMDYTIQ